MTEWENQGKNEWRNEKMKGLGNEGNYGIKDWNKGIL